MVSRDRLYQTFGELLYVLAMSDGIIQKKEIETLEEILKGHPKGDDIKWSFDYENQQQNDIETLYKKVIEVFSDNGPDEEYEFFLYALSKMAKASDSVVREEKMIIQNLSQELLKRFKNDIEKIKEKYN